MTDILEVAENIFGVKAKPLTPFDKKVVLYMQRKNLSILLVTKGGDTKWLKNQE